MGAGSSASLENYGLAMAEERYSEIIAGELGVFNKYFSLIDDLASSCGAPTPLTDISRDYFNRAIAAGHYNHGIHSLFDVMMKDSK